MIPQSVRSESVNGLFASHRLTHVALPPRASALPLAFLFVHGFLPMLQAQPTLQIPFASHRHGCDFRPRFHCDRERRPHGLSTGRRARPTC